MHSYHLLARACLLFTSINMRLVTALAGAAALAVVNAYGWMGAYD